MWLNDSYSVELWDIVEVMLMCDWWFCSFKVEVLNKITCGFEEYDMGFERLALSVKFVW